MLLERTNLISDTGMLSNNLWGGSRDICQVSLEARRLQQGEQKAAGNTAEPCVNTCSSFTCMTLCRFSLQISIIQARLKRLGTHVSKRVKPG